MIAVISGTNRNDSHTLRVANYYCCELKKHGEKVELINLQHLPSDFLFTDLYGSRSADFQAMEQQIILAEKFVFVAPEYNGSYPGVLKVFIDAFGPREAFHNKKAFLVGLSAGKFGNLRGLDHLAGVLNYLRVTVHPFRAHIPLIDEKLNVSSNTFNDPATIDEIALQIRYCLNF